MPTTNFNYLIIGQGLAGSLLSLELINQGQRVLVIDDAHKSSSSKVAAGLINPITGHRWNLTEDFFVYLAKAKECYRFWENQFGQRLLYLVDQFRTIKNQGQNDYYKNRLTQESYESLLEPSDQSMLVDRGFGASKINQSYVFDVITLLTHAKEELLRHESLLIEPFDHRELQFSDEQVIYKSLNAERIVFCQGYRAASNPWTKHLPFKLAKGSILEVRLNHSNTNFQNWGHWLAPIPSSDNKYLNHLGATHIWNDVGEDKNEADIELLIKSLNENTLYSASVESHKSGIRPTTTQRKPFVGGLSNQKHAYVLNGLGSKGCLIAPYYVEQLTQHLLFNAPLDGEVSQWL